MGQMLNSINWSSQHFNTGDWTKCLRSLVFEIIPNGHEIKIAKVEIECERIVITIK